MGWKSIRGTPYWTNGPFFFSMIVSAGAKEGSFHSSLWFKWLALDRLLWHVLDMSSNENAPFSLHANGAFVLTGWQIQSFTIRDLVWEPGVLEQQIKTAMLEAASKAEDIAREIDSTDAYMRFLDREYEKRPNAASTVWPERLLVHMLRGEKTLATEIAKDRIVKHDWGGFYAGDKTFFEHALALNEA
ncbi:hypothetical protein PPN31114_04190 [Pandoraea pneumonica]|uniref:Uncharacterized protein n=2 Tax=Pandoraea pneumonica TaxID=2508299 RepID=A0A5E4XZ63_9BURK|nr:hypothetical protein PPN31114_04190 [Pandoraea pneumonica]